MRWPILFIVVCSLMFSCSHKQPEKGKTESETEKIISRDEAMGNLPCFKCHSYQKFKETPKKGIFSHQLHVNTGFHCNQCHDFRGHQPMVINRDVCNTCHNIKEIAFNKTSMPSRFNHESHAKKNGCRECHPKIFVMKAGSANVTMKDIDSGSFCGACHNGKKAFPSSDCGKCHKIQGFDKELTYKVDSLGPVVFSHKFHSAAFPCSECHPKYFVMKKSQGKMTMDKINAGKFCGACHNGSIASDASDCGKCHK